MNLNISKHVLPLQLLVQLKNLSILDVLLLKYTHRQLQ